jgi:hypothetical protein
LSGAQQYPSPDGKAQVTDSLEFMGVVVPAAAAFYRATGLVLWRKAEIRQVGDAGQVP